MAKQSSNTSFTYPNKRIIVKPIFQSVSQAIENAGSILAGSQRSYTIATDRTTGRYVDPLTKEEREFFENSALSGTYFQKGELSVTNPKDRNFWLTGDNGKPFRVALTGDETRNVLTLDNWEDYFKYAILRSNKLEVKASSDVFRTPDHRFELVEEGYDVEAEYEASSLVSEAWDYANTELKPNVKKLKSFINIWFLDKGKAIEVGENTDDKWYHVQVEKIIRDDVQGFLRLKNDPNYEDKLRIIKAMSKGIIRKGSNGYYVRDTESTLGSSISQVISNLKDVNFHRENLLVIAASEEE